VSLTAAKTELEGVRQDVVSAKEAYVAADSRLVEAVASQVLSLSLLLWLWLWLSLALSLSLARSLARRVSRSLLLSLSLSLCRARFLSPLSHSHSLTLPPPHTHTHTHTHQLLQAELEGALQQEFVDNYALRRNNSGVRVCVYTQARFDVFLNMHLK
jgi:hypothetical protein